MFEKSSHRQSYYYFLYGMLALALVGKVLGWLFKYHNVFSDWISEGLILIFLLLSVFNVFRYLHPGADISHRLKSEKLISRLTGKWAWLFVGVLIRILLGSGLLFASYLIFKEPKPFYYFYGLLCAYFGILMLWGAVLYLVKNPYGIFLTDKHIYSYLFQYRYDRWTQIKVVSERSDCVEIRAENRPDIDINFSDLNIPRKIVSIKIKEAADLQNVTYLDNSNEYDTASS